MKEPSDPIRRRRILIVDDVHANVELLRIQLRPFEYEIEAAYDGFQALEKIRSWRPDLVLLDLMMPQMSGYEVCQKIKEDKDLCLTPVIIVTALSELDDKLKAIEIGADDFLIKPINKMELITRVRSLLRLKNLTDDLERSENILFSLAQAIEAKDVYTRGHSERVARYCRKIAKALSLSDKEADLIWRGGLLHDIGKIGVSEVILHKPGPLTPEEMEHVRTHPQKGYEICCSLGSLAPSLTVIKNHHERFDGCGHPDRMEGEVIPLFARIAAVADSFDAMTTNRPYRKAMTTADACKIFEREQEGGQWDPRIVTEFLKMFRNGFK